MPECATKSSRPRATPSAFSHCSSAGVPNRGRVMAVWNPEANEIFLRALEIVSPEARRAFLDEACRADRRLREEVESLLAANGQAGSFLESLVPEGVATVPVPVRERPGAVLGPYRLLEQIGEGG